MRIAVFDPTGQHFSAPTLTCMLEEFGKLNADIDVFLRVGGEHLTSICPARALPFPINFKLWKGDLVSTLRNWKWFVGYRGLSGQIAVRANSYDLSIGLNPEGVIAAHQLWKRTGTPYVYLSFEMMFGDELTNKGDLREKADEISASKSAALIISQDPTRARLLSKENGVPMTTMECVPVAPRGDSLPIRTDYLRHKLGIPLGKTIILFSGNYCAFNCACQITASVPLLPPNCVLVVHSFLNSNISNPFLESLKRLKSENVYITEGGLSFKAYADMVQSADIGVAFYQASGPPFNGKNITYMGLSSGKLSTYSRFGIPVICSGNPELLSYLDEYRFGEYIIDFAQIPRVIERIQVDWQTYSEAGYRFFQNKLDFNIHWPHVWNRINDIIRSNSDALRNTK